MSLQNEALVGLIRRRLSEDRRVAALPIDIHCAEGFVILAGVVDTTEQKRLAVQLVTGLIGVRNVKDRLLVKKRKIRIAKATVDDWVTA